MFILNIGLLTNKGEPLNARDVLQYVEHAFGSRVLAMTMVNSHTEPTLVVAIDRPLSIERDTIDRIARRFGQDCIATWDGTNDLSGELIGPNAAAWGDFNPCFFYTIDGNTLL